MKYSEFLKDNYSTLLAIFNCMEVGVWITDGDARVVMVNDKSLGTGGLSRKDLMGREMGELIATGYILYESSVLKAIESGHEESIIQELGEGGYVMAISVPLFYNGKIDLVICIERNITEVNVLQGLLEKQKDITEEYRSELLRLKSQLNAEEHNDLVTNNISMVRIKEMAQRIGVMDTTVIITGESGTGKEVIANLIQKNSARARMPFIKVNCAAVPESLIESEFFGYEKGTFTGADANGKIGLFELANGGTLFLDEIGELPLHIQSKLLRAIQEKEIRRIGGKDPIPIDIRLIAATNKNLKLEMEKGNFRSDLYYRLFVVPINVPPLRRRKEDIPLLANYFLNILNERYHLTKEIRDDAHEELKAYSWPGNVRELQNVVERLVVGGAGNKITGFQVRLCLNGSTQLSEDVSEEEDERSLNSIMKEYEKQVVLKAVNECRSLSAAARKLKVNKSTISRKLKEYGL